MSAANIATAGHQVDFLRIQSRRRRQGQEGQVSYQEPVLIEQRFELTRVGAGVQAQDRALDKAITYFENHRHMLDYATYLAKGYPIATGLLEGTCGSLVKDRMEQSGMHWSLLGAQAVLDQRAVKKNGDWDDFWAFYINQERERLYSTTCDRAA